VLAGDDRADGTGGEMTAFTAWKFDEPDGADRALQLLRGAADEGLVHIIDHAVVSWPVGVAQPRVSQGHEETWRSTGWGAFWGLLFGALFAVPVLGVAAGAVLGAVSQATARLGISQEQLERIRDEITEGTSGLFAVTDSGDLDRIGERFRGVHMKLVESNLTDAERKVLLDTFGS
jgi:uncharacterized membrane protein